MNFFASYWKSCMNCLSKIRKACEGEICLSLVSGICTYHPLEVEDFWQKTSGYSKKLVRAVWVVHWASHSSLLVRRPTSKLTWQQQIHCFKLFPFRKRMIVMMIVLFPSPRGVYFEGFPKPSNLVGFFPHHFTTGLSGGSDW